MVRGRRGGADGHPADALRGYVHGEVPADAAPLVPRRVPSRPLDEQRGVREGGLHEGLPEHRRLRVHLPVQLRRASMIARSRTFVPVAAIAVLLATAADHRAGTSARAAMQMEDQVKAAKTAADHEALAADYDGMAADAKTKAAEHRSMAKAYRAAGGPAGKAQLPEHCEGLPKFYDGVAKEYSAMAKAERDLAKKAK